LNFGSLFFGLVSWCVPVVFLGKKTPLSKEGSMKVVFYSLVSAMISLFMQVLYTKHLVDINDWSALLDIQGGVVFSASVLLFITIALNVQVLHRSLNNYLY
jgi:cytochrome c oxidase subunit 4